MFLENHTIIYDFFDPHFAFHAEKSDKNFFMNHFKKIQENGRMYSFLVLKSNSNIKKNIIKKVRPFVLLTFLFL